MTKTKLSPAMQRVLDKLTASSGWESAFGLGEAGSTLKALVERGLVEMQEKERVWFNWLDSTRRKCERRYRRKQDAN